MAATADVQPEIADAHPADAGDSDVAPGRAGPQGLRPVLVTSGLIGALLLTWAAVQMV